MQPFVVPLVLLAIVVVAALAGNYVVRSFRMPETGWKVSLIVAVLGVAAVILWTSWPPKQGIDLNVVQSLTDSAFFSRSDQLFE